MRALFERAELDDSSRGEAASGMCLVALEHGTALMALMALRLEVGLRGAVPVTVGSSPGIASEAHLILYGRDQAQVHR